MVSADPRAPFLAGGTTQLDLMKDGVLGPERLMDITRLPLGGITHTDSAIRVGALTTMEELAADPTTAHPSETHPHQHCAIHTRRARSMPGSGGRLM